MAGIVKRNYWIAAAGCAAAVSGYGEATAKKTPASSPAKPNFIVILADDQGYNDLGCYGSALIRTPHIDRMAAEGIRLTDFYSQPVSGPARAALLTGSYPLRIAEVGNLKRFHPMVHPDEVLIPEILGSAGYTSACIGKWDINGHMQTFASETLMPTAMGFDYWFGVPSSIDNGVEDIYRNRERLTHDFTVDTLTQLYTAETLGFIERNSDRPFFIYLAHSMPHTRLGASSVFRGRSSYGLYGDAVEELDWSVGEIIRKLKALGIDQNTYIIYTSDNGPWDARGTHGGSAYPLRGNKIDTWEGGVRVPCVIWRGGMRRGETVSHVCSTLDLLPTLASMAGAGMPGDRLFDGHDISGLLHGQGIDTPELYFYYIDTHLQAVRQGDWKLVLPRPQAPEWVSTNAKSVWRREDMDPVRANELYNLRDDPGERRDIAAAHPEIVAALLQRIEEARGDIGDFDHIGTGAHFFDDGPRRPDALRWREKEAAGWKPEIKVHPYYDDGARTL